MQQFLKFIFGIKLCMFRTAPLSIIRCFSLYTQQWYMSYRFADICEQDRDGLSIASLISEFHMIYYIVLCIILYEWGIRILVLLRPPNCRRYERRQWRSKQRLKLQWWPYVPPAWIFRNVFCDITRISQQPVIIVFIGSCIIVIVEE